MTLSWTGNAAGQDSRKWSVAANWDPAARAGSRRRRGVPDSGSKEKAPINDLASDPALGGIIVSDRSYELTGKGLKLAPNSSSRIEEDFRVDSLEGGGTIELNGETVLTVGPRGGDPLKPSTTFSGNWMAAMAELVKDGLGELIFAGDASLIEPDDR